MLVCKICGCPFCHLDERRDGFCSPHCEPAAEYCKSCLEKHSNESIRMDDSSPYATPLVSPSSSFKSCFTSYGSFSSSYGSDSLTDLSLYSRVDSFGSERNDTRDATDHNHSNQEPLENAQHDYETWVRDIYIESNDTKTNKDESRANNLEKLLSSSSFTSDGHIDGNEDKTDSDNILDPPKVDPEYTPGLLLPNFDVDLWEVPEAEADLAISNNNKGDDDDYDDDDEGYTDGIKWVRSSSFSSLTEEPVSNKSYSDEKQKAMVEAMNGQFQILVSRLLASEGITFSAEEGDQSWLKIVASLSWEAAQLVKPDEDKGAMDPGSYVKVKCIATGSRHESRVIDGLVFKRNAAHKHMPSRFSNPKLLLLEGVLGQSAGSLSSFVSMEQEKDHLKSIIEMIDSCHPNIVLVEKTVSRDIQEALLSKEVTLVFDMKRHRLERIARCSASSIISFSGIQEKLELKHCRSFHTDKIVEELNISGEGGKKPSKTLMFLEGFRKPLGCTILLKGSHSEELKKIKRVIQYTVFAAYHLILETSFFADQRVFFTHINPVREGINNIQCKPLSTVDNGAAGCRNSDLENCKCPTPIARALDIPIQSGSLEISAKENTSVVEPVSQISSGLLEDNPYVNLTRGVLARGDFLLDVLIPNDVDHSESLDPGRTRLLQSTASTLGYKPKEGSLGSPTLQPVLSDSGLNSPTIVSQTIEPRTLSELSDPEKIIQRKPEYVSPYGEQDKLGRNLSEEVKYCIVDASTRQDKDNIESVLDPQSILILFSRQCITKQTICEQSHLSRIKYYRNFDTSLGRYLKEKVLDQNHECPSCHEPPTSHVYNYTHQNGNLTMLVKQLSMDDKQSAKSDGKIWMWIRCLRCKSESAKPKKRVVLSDSACGLSFGKFLDLSFSGHSAASRLSQCGHSLHRDCLRFFKLGSMIAMLKYSPVEIYAALKPPSMLEFNNPKGREWIKKEINDVRAKGNVFFSEVSSLVQKLKLSQSGRVEQQMIQVSDIKELSRFEDMLKQEKDEFEAATLKAADSELLDLKWLNQELRFQLYLWDQRFIYFWQDGQSKQQKDGGSHNNSTNRNVTLVGGENLEASFHVVELSSSGGHRHSQERQTVKEIEPTKTSGITSISSDRPLDVEHAGLECQTGYFPNRSVVEDVTSSSLDKDHDSSASVDGTAVKGQEKQEYASMTDHMQVDHSTKDSKGGAVLEKTNSVELEVNMPFDEKVDKFMLNEQTKVSELPSHAKVELSKKLIWSPFSELRKELRNDLLFGSLQKFDFISTYTPTCLSSVFQTSTYDMDWLHFPVGLGGLVLTASVGEISSIIACALAVSEDRQGLLNLNVKEVREGKGTIHRSTGSVSDCSMVSSYLMSTGSYESEGLNSFNSFSSSSSDESASSTYVNSSSVDHLLASKNLHPEIPLGTTKIAGKCKFSVVCIHAKEFYDLRRKCCPSEFAYISSLSHCKKWDPQGGKSKAFFAKSMDNRFIIKQIKKAELDSFLKFAPDYFKHVSLSMDSGSQTCLAKILGIYQVRQYRSGKEIKFDVMVMENLLYGHTISRTYDLKGSVFSRYVLDGHDNEVFLDQNFVEDMRVSPIYIGSKTKHLLQRAIWNDTSFLTSINVMDYSLLVGVDKQQHEIVFGIIDYLRQYTWDKQLETWVKTSIVVPKNELPTVISPKEYKKRFRKFMAKYFLTVPDTWNGENCLASCKFCNDDRRSSAKVHNVALPQLAVKTKS